MGFLVSAGWEHEAVESPRRRKPLVPNIEHILRQLKMRFYYLIGM